MYAMIFVICAVVGSPQRVDCADGRLPFEFVSAEQCARAAAEYNDRINSRTENVLGEAKCVRAEKS